jgi:hypothetical protein
VHVDQFVIKEERLPGNDIKIRALTMCCSLEDISDKYINMCDVNPRYLVQSKTYMHMLHKVN